MKLRRASDRLLVFLVKFVLNSFSFDEISDILVTEPSLLDVCLMEAGAGGVEEVEEILVWMENLTEFPEELSLNRHLD